jgi:hypothetical protein
MGLNTQNRRPRSYRGEDGAGDLFVRVDCQRAAVRAVTTVANLAAEALARHPVATVQPPSVRARVWRRTGRREGRSAPTHQTAKGCLRLQQPNCNQYPKPPAAPGSWGYSKVVAQLPFVFRPCMCPAATLQPPSVRARVWRRTGRREGRSAPTHQTARPAGLKARTNSRPALAATQAKQHRD